MQATAVVPASAELERSVRLQDVAFVRGAFRLGPISFSLAPGEVLYVAGPNGSGKSTLLHLVAGLLVPNGGEIHLGGRLVAAKRIDIPPWRRGAAILLQDLGLWPHLSIRTQCLLVAGASRNGTRRATRAVAAARLDEWSTALAAGALLDKRPAALSGGEAQRCALLRTLMQDVPVLLLDEPMSEQHRDGIERIDGIIAALAGARKTLLVAGHRQPPGSRRLDLGSEKGAAE